MTERGGYNDESDEFVMRVNRILAHIQSEEDAGRNFNKIHFAVPFASSRRSILCVHLESRKLLLCYIHKSGIGNIVKSVVFVLQCK